MSRESEFIARLRAAATDPAARGLRDDAAVLVPPAGAALVVTHDMLVEDVHYLVSDPPADVAWKLLAVNLSDLAAKGAMPLGVLTGHMLGRDAAWDLHFADGLVAALAAFGVPLLGGDTVSGTGPRVLGLTAIGVASDEGVPARGGARAGDHLCVVGTIGAAGLGLTLAQAGATAPRDLLDAFRRPVPRLAEGRALAGLVNAMSDVSDGLLIDAGRMGEASGLSLTIELAAVPYPATAAVDRIAAVTAGDDYALLCAIPPAALTESQARVPHLCVVGRFAPGAGLSLTDDGRAVALPARLGFEHGARG